MANDIRSLVPVDLTEEIAATTKRKRSFAEPVAVIRAVGTGEVVGWIYRWNDGTESRLLASDLPAGWYGSKA